MNLEDRLREKEATVASYWLRRLEAQHGKRKQKEAVLQQQLGQARAEESALRKQAEDCVRQVDDVLMLVEDSAQSAQPVPRKSKRPSKDPAQTPESPISG
ncbi:unnamed protein product, partial [Symbiodinium natans]